jgi:hypothetical protein
MSVSGAVRFMVFLRYSIAFLCVDTLNPLILLPWCAPIAGIVFRNFFSTHMHPPRNILKIY